MTEPLLPSSFLFNFAVPCRSKDHLWSTAGAKLDESYRLPHLGTMDGKSTWADLRMAWSSEGFGITLIVSGKRQPPWCRGTRIEDSDGLQIWIDTRNTANIHRANRFCHRFAFLPTGGGRNLESPFAVMLGINRARESPKPVPHGTLPVLCARRIDGYRLEAHIPAAALTGFDPVEQPRVGFMYAVIDRELGWQTLRLGPEFPIDEDPEMWSSMELR